MQILLHLRSEALHQELRFVGIAQRDVQRGCGYLRFVDQRKDLVSFYDVTESM